MATSAAISGSELEALLRRNGDVAPPLNGGSDQRRVVGSDLVIVANRLPVSFETAPGSGASWVRSPGGLASALAPITAERSSTWVGWPGIIGEPSTNVPTHVGETELASVKLSVEEHTRYYQGFCNAGLWPLLHGDIVPAQIDAAAWGVFRTVNARFAAVASKAAAPGATVWVHDYQLMLVPHLLRLLRPDLRIGFFLHVPMHAENSLRTMPWYRELIEGMLGADLIGFQTPRDVQAFASYAVELGEIDGVDGSLRIRHGRRETRCAAYAASVDALGLHAASQSEDTLRAASEIREALGEGRRVILGVDRLDYTKGIPTRLKAYSELLRDGVLSPHEVVFVQVAAPSRQGTFGYERAQKEVEAAIAQTLTDCPDIAYAPVRYLRRNLSFEELVPLYLAADVMCVTPFVDGMNLVAKEYVAARADSGALVLSRHAGAAQELTGAWLVDPEDLEDIKRGLLDALRSSPEERAERMRDMSAYLRVNDDRNWVNTFVGDLDNLHA